MKKFISVLIIIIAILIGFAFTSPVEAKSKLRIGGSCIGRYGITNIYTTTSEVRLLQNNEHQLAWEYIEFCIKNRIYLIINIDSYQTGGRWRPDNQQLRDYVVQVKNRVRKLGGKKSMVRFTVDNEADEYDTFENYCNRVRVVHDALGGQFYLGAGNFRSNNWQWYTKLAEIYHKGWFEVFDFHMQDGFNTQEQIKESTGWYLKLINDYHISRRSCTEANNFQDVINNYEYILELIRSAEILGCEDICIAFIDYIPNNAEPYMSMSFWLNGQPRDQNICNDLINRMKGRQNG